ncbi:Hypothetical protein POVN_LOCUS533 [uncultured virus]|nr:Hypothetical protein POVN_LOCUS533 [uncultured virus]
MPVMMNIDKIKPRGLLDIPPLYIPAEVPAEKEKPCILPPLSFKRPTPPKIVLEPPVAPLLGITELLKWDGSNLGAIDEHIENYTIVDSRVRLHFRDGSKAHANRFDNSVALIADELKPLFGLPKIGRHRCTITGRNAIISKIECDDESPFGTSYATPEHLGALQRCYLFRWALGLTYNVDASLWMRNYRSGVSIITSYKELKVNYTNDNPLGAKIPKSAMKRWFSDWEQVTHVAEKLFSHRTMIDLRFEIDAIVRRIDKEWVSWTGQIVRRIQERL